MPTTPIAYDPQVVEERIGAQRRRTVSAAVGVLTSLVLIGGMYAYFQVTRSMTPDTRSLLLAFLAWSVGIGLLLVLLRGLWWWRMTRQRVAPGLALQLSPLGVEVEGARIRWEDVTAMRAVWSRLGDGHRLRLEWTGGSPVELPLDALTILPGSLDSAVRAHSGDRVRVDLSAYGA